MKTWMNRLKCVMAVLLGICKLSIVGSFLDIYTLRLSSDESGIYIVPQRVNTVNAQISLLDCMEPLCVNRKEFHELQ